MGLFREEPSVEEDLALQPRAVALGVGGEQPVGCGVVRGDGRLDLAYQQVADDPGRQRVQQDARESPAAMRAVDGDLPDDEGLGTFILI
jgi:hypothetical protein